MTFGVFLKKLNKKLRKVVWGVLTGAGELCINHFTPNETKRDDVVMMMKREWNCCYCGLGFLSRLAERMCFKLIGINFRPIT
jgi:hypothetical protein